MKADIAEMLDGRVVMIEAVWEKVREWTLQIYSTTTGVRLMLQTIMEQVQILGHTRTYLL